jgi:hypothetical protein
MLLSLLLTPSGKFLRMVVAVFVDIKNCVIWFHERFKGLHKLFLGPERHKTKTIKPELPSLHFAFILGIFGCDRHTQSKFAILFKMLCQIGFLFKY